MAKYVHPMYIQADLICPQCNTPWRRLSPSEGNTVSANCEFVCQECETVFEVYIVLPDPEAAQHQMQRTACTHPEKKIIGAIPYCKVCGEQLD